MIKSIIFVGCVRIYCCKDFNVCPQAAISKNKSNKILNNTSPAVRRIGLILKERVFGNQKVATIGFKWPTKSLNEDKNSFLPKMYSYDVIYLQNRRFAEVVFYLKEKNVLFKNRACKNLKALLCHPSIKILPNQLFLTEILMSSAISKNLLLLLLSRSLLKSESIVSWKSTCNISSPENKPKNTGK